MPDTTDNHGYQLFNDGETDWEHRTDFSNLDIDVEVRDTDANRTNYAPKTDAKYLATDTGTIYIGDGTAWNELGTIGSGDSAGIGDHHTATGDGVTQTFQWDTGVTDSSDLQYVTIDASTEAASADYERFIDGTDVGVRYADAPADGVQLGWYWSVNASVETVETTAEIDAYAGDGTFIGSYSELATGDNLTGSVTNGRLTLNASGGSGGHSIEDNGTEVTADVSRVNFTTDLNVIDDGSGAVSVESTASTSGDGSHTWQVVSGSTGSDIQSALDAAAPNGAVFLPQGTYDVSSEILLTSAHNGVTFVGEGYGSHIRGDGNVTWLFRVRDSANPIYNLTIEKIRFSNGDYSNLAVHSDTHPGSRGIVLRDIWSHNGDRGIMIGANGTALDGARAWDCSHNGISYHGDNDIPEGAYEHYRLGNNLIAWDNQNSDGTVYGIDLSKQSAHISNFLCFNNDNGIKTSNDSHRLSLSNGYLINNRGHGFIALATDAWGPYRMDNVVAEDNGGRHPTKSDGDGFNFRGSEWQVGNIYAHNNDVNGIAAHSGAEIVISSAFSEGNGNYDVYDNATGFFDIMHYAGDTNFGTGGDGGNLWVLRSHDYGGALH